MSAMLNAENARDAQNKAQRELCDLLTKDPNARSAVIGYIEARIENTRVRIGSCAKDELETMQAAIKELVALHGSLTR